MITIQSEDLELIFKATKAALEYRANLGKLNNYPDELKPDFDCFSDCLNWYHDMLQDQKSKKSEQIRLAQMMGETDPKVYEDKQLEYQLMHQEYMRIRNIISYLNKEGVAWT
ncbi:hypothetical protein V6R21_32360 [Limibacter armeniacum]|uniref:hypothetical protein n=1 Tax=Limibacter armeniacum TaxID=466084 RepID=UPI002FE6A1AD